MPFVTDTDRAITGITCGVGTLVMLIFFLFCFKPRARRLSAEELEEQEKQDRLEDPNYRQHLINRSLIVKQVTGADPKQGRFTLGKVQNQEQEHLSEGDVSSPSKQPVDDDLDCEDPSIPCCSICLEPYRVGAIVAWSRDTYLDDTASNGGDREQSPCVHVFHRDCIVPWLENPSHDDCPACRTILLKPKWDEENEDNSIRLDENEDESGQQDQARTGLKRFLSRTISRILRQGHRDETGHQVEDEEPDTTVHTSITVGGMIFEIVHGLVSRGRRASCSLIGQDIPVSPPPARAADPHGAESKFLDAIVAAQTVENSLSSSASKEEDDTSVKGDLLLSCDDSAVWEKPSEPEEIITFKELEP